MFRRGIFTMRPALEAVVFDLDGTLTLPHALDFDLMRKRVGAPEGTDVLAFAHALEGEDKARAFAAIEEIETSVRARRAAVGKRCGLCPVPGAAGA